MLLACPTSYGSSFARHPCCCAPFPRLTHQVTTRTTDRLRLYKYKSFLLICNAISNQGDRGTSVMSADQANVDHLLKALDLFEQWSNYMLVTTVAALGWVASRDSSYLPLLARRLVVFCLGVSIIFAVFTLALTPLVGESITSTTESIYFVDAHFSLFGARSMRLKCVCFPQHIFFLLGIAIYTIANAWWPRGRTS
jgi:hypothetical protein